MNTRHYNACVFIISLLCVIGILPPSAESACLGFVPNLGGVSMIAIILFVVCSLAHIR
jgi:hypothetical protein